MPEAQLKVDDKGAPVLQDGKPVFTIDGKDQPLDVGSLLDVQGKFGKLSGDLDRLRPLAARAAEFDGLDAKKAREWESEVKKLRGEAEAAKHGTTDEAVDKLVLERFGRKLEDETAKVTSIEAKWKEEKAAREKTEERLRDRAIDSEVALAAGLLEWFIPEALEDARIMARRTFALNAEGEPEARDSSGAPVFGPDGKTALTIKDWLAGTRKTKPHWWKAGLNGGGAVGGPGSAGGGAVISRADAENPQKYKAAKAAAEKRGVPLQIEG